VIDDYAHNPARCGGALETARIAFRGRRVIAAFQPRLYHARAICAEFATSLRDGPMRFSYGDLYPRASSRWKG